MNRKLAAEQTQCNETSPNLVDLFPLHWREGVKHGTARSENDNRIPDRIETKSKVPLEFTDVYLFIYL